MSDYDGPYEGAPGWIKPRPYPHFDAANEGQRLRQSEAHALDRAAVATRRFYPFIRRIKVTPRYTRRKPDRKKTRTLKRRPIDYAAHSDSHVFARYGDLLEKEYTRTLIAEGLAEAVVAYRRIERLKDGKGKNNVDHAGEVFQFVREKSEEGPLLTLAFDVSDFFGSMDHERLKRQWLHVLPESEYDLTYEVRTPEGTRVKGGSGGSDHLPKDHHNVFRSVTRFTYVSERALEKTFRRFYRLSRRKRRGQAICTPEEFRTHVRGGKLIHMNRSGRGIPQGSPMSAVLSNIYMLPLDRKLAALAADLGGLYRRYSDDLMFVVPEAAGDQVANAVDAALREQDLEPQHRKTERVRFVRDAGALTCQPADGKTKRLQYLGFTFDGKSVDVRPGSLNRYLRKIQSSVPGIRDRAARLARQGKDPGRPRFLIYKLYTEHCKKLRVKKGQRRPFNFILYLERACDRFEEFGLDVSPIRQILKRHMRYVLKALKPGKKGRRKRRGKRRAITRGGYA